MGEKGRPDAGGGSPHPTVSPTQSLRPPEEDENWDDEVKSYFAEVAQRDAKRDIHAVEEHEALHQEEAATAARLCSQEAT